MFEMKLATCAALMGVLPESTGSLKTSYFSRESISRAARPKEARGLYLPLKRAFCRKRGISRLDRRQIRHFGAIFIFPTQQRLGVVLILSG